MGKFFALMFFAGLPALALFMIFFLCGTHWVLAGIVGLGAFGFGLDVCLRGR